MATKIRLKKSAIENVKRLFINSPNEDVVSLKDALRSWGRPDPENVEANKPWLSNLMTHLSYHNLVVPVYSYGDGRKKLDKLQLTIEGKRALGRIAEDVDKTNQNSYVTSGYGNCVDFKNVTDVIARLKRANPEFEIVFEMRLIADKGQDGHAQAAAVSQ